MPCAFVGHVALTLGLDEHRGGQLRDWARSVPKPRAVLAVSARGEHTPMRIEAVRSPPLTYDGSGFPFERH